MGRRREIMAFLVTVSLVLVLSVFTTSSHAAPEDFYSRIFEKGSYGAETFNVPGTDPWFAPKCRTETAVPVPAGEEPARTLLIAVPSVSGEYPVVHLQHGFMLHTAYYSDLMKHIASHGFIVIAPQMPNGVYDVFAFDASDEIAYGAAVINWYPNNLARAIAHGVSRASTTNIITPDLKRLALLGHSRGGKVSFGLATGLCKTSLDYVAIAGLDPIDGGSPNKSINPKVLPYEPQGLNLRIPTLIVGEDLAGACSPAGVNQVQFFENSGPPAIHFVAQEYGHMDVLNDKLDLWGYVTAGVCKAGPSRQPMRTFAGGMVVGFLQASMYDDPDAINYYWRNPQKAPVKLDPPQETGWFETDVGRRPSQRGNRHHFFYGFGGLALLGFLSRHLKNAYSSILSPR